MRAIKRRSIGSLVAVDVTGAGEMVYGTIVDIDGGKTTIEPADGSQEVITPAGTELFKPTQAEVDAWAKGDSEKPTKKAPSKKVEADPDSDFLPSEYDDEDAEDDEDDEGSRSIVPEKYRASYSEDRTADGRKTLHNNDKVAGELAGKDLAEVKKHVAAKIGTSAAMFTKRWGHLNNGQQRMLIGNAYRQWLKENGK